MGINPSNAQVAQILQQLKSGQEDESLNLIPVERFEEVGPWEQTCMSRQAGSKSRCSHCLLGHNVAHQEALPSLMQSLDDTGALICASAARPSAGFRYR